MIETKERVSVEVLEVQPAHMYLLGEKMRSADRLEVWASHHRRSHAAVQWSVDLSAMSRTVKVDGDLCCIFGVVPGKIDARVGVPWMLCTDEIERHPTWILRLGKSIIHEWRNQYALLCNYILADNEAAVRWLEWLGFTLNDPEPFGPDGALFHYFYMRGN